jgi:hypothetical protein
MSDLTTSARFKTYAGITGTAQDTLIGQLITEVSAAIEQYLRRTLVSTTYKSWLDGTGSPLLRLKQWPVTAIYQVSISSSSVGYVYNSSSTVSRASVSFDGTNLSLAEMSTAGVQTISDLPVATSKVLSTLKTAIEAKSGWNCTLNSSEYEGEPSSLLRPIYGQDAFDSVYADLYLPDDPDPVKLVTEDAIELVYDRAFMPQDVFPSTLRSPLGCGFPTGTANIFAWFKAGYTLPTDDSVGTMPGGLLLLVHQITQDVLSSTKLNSNLQSESIGGYSYSLRATADGAVASAIENRKRELNQYRSVGL